MCQSGLLLLLLLKGSFAATLEDNSFEDDDGISATDELPPEIMEELEFGNSDDEISRVDDDDGHIETIHQKMYVTKDTVEIAQTVIHIKDDKLCCERDEKTKPDPQCDKDKFPDNMTRTGPEPPQDKAGLAQHGVTEAEVVVAVLVVPTL
ncbi:hypothetical protein Zmor_016812 [Zophobas morio]|uniref:Uncharacterized protein n=1 Tax=Zophobas morio TaxID=2755281 RepID=A0AA38I7A8_9CUCU|nr:hypothetical protein Zmor_016812 [Zophobas morio]